MSCIETVFERLLVAVQEQTAALEACIHDPMCSRALGTCLLHTMDRLDRVAVLIVVRSVPGRNGLPQRSIAAKLDALHGRAEPLLAYVRHGPEIETRRFATQLAALDPLASVRSGPDGIVDISEKMATGVPMRAALQYRAEDGGPLAYSEALLADVTLHDADLRLAPCSPGAYRLSESMVRRAAPWIAAAVRDLPGAEAMVRLFVFAHPHARDADELAQREGGNGHA
jgi:hypothetical protein